MEISEIVRALVATDSCPVTLYRSLVRSPLSSVITRRLNGLLIDAPEVTDAVVVLSIFPALKWNLKGESVDKVMEKLNNSSVKMKALERTQKLLVEVSGFQPKLLLEQREEYFKACREVVSLTERTIERIAQFPGEGKIYQKILLSTIGNLSDEELPTKYLLNKNIGGAVELFHDVCQDEMKPLLDVILNGYVMDDAEMMELYHNTTLLLREYNRIMWYSNSSLDKAMQLLSCQTEQQMLGVTESDEKFSQAYLIGEYAKLITGAVEMVKEFPLYGEDYHRILRVIFDAKPQKVSDETLARQVEMSTYSFSIKKRRALSVLGCVLWGCDGDAFIRLLADEK